MTILAPKAIVPGEPIEDEPLAEVPSWSTGETTDVPEDMGRRYRRISGDVNPIHLHALPAKLFGFKRAIAHGLWMLGDTVGRLEGVPESATLRARFRRPVFLPSTVQFRHGRAGDSLRFEVRTGSGDKAHLEGEVAVIDAD